MMFLLILKIEMVDRDENESMNLGHIHFGTSALLSGGIFIEREVSRGGQTIAFFNVANLAFLSQTNQQTGIKQALQTRKKGKGSISIDSKIKGNNNKVDRLYVRSMENRWR